MKKTGIVIALVLVAALALMGCGGKQEAPAEGFMEGTLVDASASTILVQGADGAEYLFNRGEAKVEGDDALAVGDGVRVYYTGEVEKDSANAQPVTLTRIVVTTAEGAGDGDVGGSIEGTITDASMNTISIAADGRTLTFSTMDAEVDGSLNVGETVVITFDGELDESAEVQSVQVTRVVVTGGAAAQQPATQQPAASSQAQQPAGETKTLEGTVEDVAPAALYMSDATGVVYQFTTTDVEIEGELAEGGSVTVYYIGELWSQPDPQDVTVVKIVAG
ncbi:hypothetical protein LJC64_03200 [Ruminococcaceae bacterium OttesenSCG-928-A11]|nr:hypothetical protein [Ruminococcaceae bacterium OttesenSCG-928-A11]